MKTPKEYLEICGIEGRNGEASLIEQVQEDTLNAVMLDLEPFIITSVKARLTLPYLYAQENKDTKPLPKEWHKDVVG